ncbi:MAG: phage tail assembly protein [Desulfobacter sp.]
MNQKDIKISFDPPLTIGEESLTEITMREPLVKDMRHVDRLGGTDLEKEVVMISRLTRINPEDLDRLSVNQYKQLQDHYAAFFTGHGQN